MADKAFRPLEDDPSADMVLQMFNADEEWLLGIEGDQVTSAAEVMQRDGSHHQVVILMQIPGRFNKTGKKTTIRVMLDPDDAINLAKNIASTYSWLEARKMLSN